MSGLSVILFDVVLIVVTMSVLTWLESRGSRRNRHAAPSVETPMDDRRGRGTMRRTMIALAAGLVNLILGTQLTSQEKQDLVAFLRAL